MNVALADLYKKRIVLYQNQADRLRKTETLLSTFRLVTFILAFVAIILLRNFSALLATGVAILMFGFFAFLVRKFVNTEKQRFYFSHLVEINKKEFESLAGKQDGFADGRDYSETAHNYSNDLDLFGTASLFQYLNRTSSRPAADMLAAWLKTPAKPEEISLRQQAIKELQPLIDWRQNLITLGYLNKKAGDSPALLEAWVNSTDLFVRARQLKFITGALSTIGWLSTALVIAFGLPAGLLVPVFCVNFLFYFSQGKKINLLHQQVSKSSELMETYSAAISSIESMIFQSDHLNRLKKTFVKNIPASVQIKKLSRLVSRLDTRMNVMVAIPLNLFVFWDIHCCLALEKWKRDHVLQLSQWFSAMAEYEVLSCFSNMAFNNPRYAYPEFVPDYFYLRAEELGHPLIPSERRITNSFQIEGDEKVIVVTGSNMSGKSTFLRTCGVNTVLAMAGAPVCAKSFTIFPVQVFSSMRISDSLEDNTSSFYAELKKLATIIKAAESGQKVFLLLDEILRGTNSNDRYTGSVALIRQLLGSGSVAIVATHDLKLAELAEALPGRVDNYHFDVKVDGEELYFDYKLTPGICTSLNASLLMKKMGIRMD
jgi:DNA mismatch repair ATPase MutS